MAFTVRHVDQPADRRREFWTWCFQNGFRATQVAGAVVIDTDQRTVTVTHWLPVDQPGDPDFPELRRDCGEAVRRLSHPRPTAVMTADRGAVGLVGVFR